MAKITPTVKEDNQLYYLEGQQAARLSVGTAEWAAWLVSAKTFAFSGPGGTFTARKEQAGHKRGGWYWRAYRKRNNQLYQLYLGRDDELTPARLDQIAQELDCRSRATTPGNKYSAPPEPPLSLIATKLYIPPSPGRLVERPRLLYKLEQARRARLTLISAAPGFGKTTLIAAWLNEAQVSFGWLSLDEADNDPARFWMYLVQALAKVQPRLAGLGVGLSNTLSATSFEQVVTLILNGLADLEKDVFVALDDYHVIENPAIRQGMIFFIEHLPPRLHLIITSRSEPALPLGRLRARGDLVEIRAADLRFDSQEVVGFLGQAMGLALSSDEIAVLEDKTEGWVAGLQLAALGIQGHQDVAGFIQAFKGSHRFMLDYLSEEVLERQPPEIQRFLLQTAILDRLSAGLVEELTGCSDGQAMLRRLEQSNLFLVALDEEREWYRYHRLFREYLYRRLQQQQAEYVSRLNRRAAEWFHQQRLTFEAVPYALASLDFERAADLLEEIAQDVLMRGELTTLQKWLTALPADILKGHPNLYFFRAWALTINGQLEDAEQLMEVAVEQTALDDPQQARLAEMVAIRTMIAIQRLDISSFMELFKLKLADLPTTNPFLNSIKLLLEGIRCEMSGDTVGAWQAYSKASQISRESGNRLIYLVASGQVADQLIVRGKLRQAMDIYQEAHQMLQPGGYFFEIRQNSLWTSMIYVGLGTIYYHWNNIEQARFCFETAIKFAQIALNVSQQFGNKAAQVASYVGLAGLRQAQGEPEQALELFKLSFEIFEDHLEGLLLEYLNYSRVRLWQRQARWELVEGWAKDFALLMDDPNYSLAEMSQMHEIAYMIFCRWLIHIDEPNKALELLSVVLESTLINERMTLTVECNILQALAHSAKSEPGLALEYLEKALQLAELEGYIRIFADEDYKVAVLLAAYRRTQASRKVISIAYLDKLIQAFDSPRDQPAHAAQLISELPEPISPRELEVLNQLALGLAASQIATELVVSTGTVKWHLKNLYGKLAVHNRVQALARARELGILAPLA